MKGLDSAKQLDQQEEYLALVESPLRLELHQVVAHQAHSVRLREVSVALPSMVRAGLAIEPVGCLLYTSPSPRDRQKSRMPSSA